MQLRKMPKCLGLMLLVCGIQPNRLVTKPMVGTSSRGALEGPKIHILSLHGEAPTVHKFYRLDSVRQREHLLSLEGLGDVKQRKLVTNEFKGLVDLFEKYSARWTNEEWQGHLDGAFSALLTSVPSVGRHADDIAVWIDVLAGITQAGRGRILMPTTLEAGIRYQLYDVLAKYRSPAYPQEYTDLTRYIQSFINILKDKYKSCTEFACKPWEQEIVFPKQGLSKEMRNYDFLRLHIERESQFSDLREALSGSKKRVSKDERKEARKVAHKLLEGKYLSMAKIDSPLSARSKTTCIAWLYHLTKSKIKGVGQLAYSALEHLIDCDQLLFEHDYILVTEIFKKLHAP